MERINQSKVWKSFSRGDGNDSATCTHCSKTISFKGSSTISGHFRRLKSKLKLSLESEEDQSCSSQKAKIKQKSITSFLESKKEGLHRRQLKQNEQFLLQECLLHNYGHLVTT